MVFFRNGKRELKSSCYFRNRKYSITHTSVGRLVLVLTRNLNRELMDATEHTENQRGQIEPLVLLPLEVMLKPLELRFRYHFEGDRPTNRLDKVCSHQCSSLAGD